MFSVELDIPQQPVPAWCFQTRLQRMMRPKQGKAADSSTASEPVPAWCFQTRLQRMASNAACRSR